MPWRNSSLQTCELSRYASIADFSVAVALWVRDLWSAQMGLTRRYCYSGSVDSDRFLRKTATHPLEIFGPRSDILSRGRRLAILGITRLTQACCANHTSIPYSTEPDGEDVWRIRGSWLDPRFFRCPPSRKLDRQNRIYS